MGDVIWLFRVLAASALVARDNNATGALSKYFQRGSLSAEFVLGYY